MSLRKLTSILLRQLVDKSCGNAIGHSLTIKMHYQTYASKFEEKFKVAKCKRKNSVHKFVLMGPDSKIHVCYGTSLKSGKDAYIKTMKMLKTTGIKIQSRRLD